MIAVDSVKQMVAAGVSAAPVLGDEFYGNASELTWELRQLGLEYFLNAGGDLHAWTAPVKVRFAKRYLERRRRPARSHFHGGTE